MNTMNVEFILIRRSRMTPPGSLIGSIANAFSCTVILVSSAIGLSKSHRWEVFTAPRSSRTRSYRPFPQNRRSDSELADCGGRKHLLLVFRTIDNNFKPDLTLGLVVRMFDEGEIVNGEFEYERHTLRVIVQERLSHLKALGNMRDISGQDFLDVARGKCIAPPPRFALTRTC